MGRIVKLLEHFHACSGWWDVVLLPPMKFNALVSSAVMLSVAAASGQDEAVNPNVGHTHHHHVYQDDLPTVPAGPDRFITSREGAAAMLLPEEKDAFQFVVFGDRTGGPPEGVGVLADAVRDVNLLAPDMVLTVGDLLQGYNTRKDWIPQANEYKEIMNQLSSPWFPVAGNHDIYWRGKNPENRPQGENENLFETHFGPLWYAFSHKNSWFIVLYSDEGVNPETGIKDFKSPDAQKMSPQQFNWLEETLKKAKGADHVFVFLHHPRWLGSIGHGGYGNDWDRVHELLKSAGNVSAVFAGHVHQMRSDGPRDGIEYITLATTGGQVPGYGEALGYLHHYDVVTVRKQGISLAAIPVGKVLDPREMTGKLIEETKRFSEQALTPEPTISLSADGAVASSEFEMMISNPTLRPVDYTLNADSEDSRWSFTPDHRHGTLPPGGNATLRFQATRVGSPLDETFRDPRLILEADYLAPGFRYTIPKRVLAVPVKFAENSNLSEVNRALHFDGVEDFLKVPSAGFDPGEAITVECRFKADSFDKRTGLVTKTQGSDYGIFVNNGKPAFTIFIGDRYLGVRAKSKLLKPGEWHHLAGLYDGKEARLYLDGRLIASKAREGIRKRNDLPLVIGGDVDSAGTAASHFNGAIDYVRVSKVARYQGDGVTVPERFENDADTSLLLQLDEVVGLRLPDSSSSGADAERCGKPTLVPSH